MLNRQDDIVESKAIRDILKFIHFNTWLIVDLDNTLMHPLQIRGMDEAEGELGSDQWFEKLFKEAQAITCSQPSMIEKVLELYHEVQHHLNMQVVEENIGMIVDRLQNLGIPVIGLTARGEILKQTTMRQLKEIGIELDRIIFCDGKNKGECAEKFLKGFPPNYLPGHIAMIDDKKKHLESVKKAVEKFKIKFDGIRYGYLDEKVEKVDMEKAHEQLAKLKSHLPFSTQIIIEELKLLPAKKSQNVQMEMEQRSFSIEYQAVSHSVQIANDLVQEEGNRVRVKM